VAWRKGKSLEKLNMIRQGLPLSWSGGLGSWALSQQHEERGKEIRKKKKPETKPSDVAYLIIWNDAQNG